MRQVEHARLPTFSRPACRAPHAAPGIVTNGSPKARFGLASFAESTCLELAPSKTADRYDGHCACDSLGAADTTRTSAIPSSTNTPAWPPTFPDDVARPSGRFELG